MNLSELQSLGQLTLHLYAANRVPVPGDDMEGYSEPLAVPEYIPIALDGSLWTLQRNKAAHIEQRFKFTKNVEVWGYFVTGPSETVMWGERFVNAPFRLPESGGEIAITLFRTVTN